MGDTVILKCLIAEVYGDGEAYEIEVFDAKGKTLGLLTLKPDQIERTKP